MEDSMIPALTTALERLHPDYTVESYDVTHTLPAISEDTYILQNLYLKGRSKPSACGRFDGMPVPMIIAPSCLPFAGYIVRVSRQQEMAL